MSRLVAAMTRTSTSIVSLPPTRWNLRSSSARSRSSWSLGETSPTSSRKSLPPCAISNFLERLAQDHVLADEILLRHHLLHEQAELLGVEGLHEIVRGPELHRPHRRIHGGVGGHHDHRGVDLETACRLRACAGG